jgi:hypothetical protein
VRFQPFRSTTAACALALALAAATVSRAQAPATAPAAGPVAVVAITSYDKLMADVDWLGTLMQAPGASQMVDGYLTQMTGGQGLAGLDKSKPIGLVVNLAPGPMPMPIVAAYVPVTDQAQLLGMLQTVLGVTNQDMGNGILQVNAMGQDVYAKSAGGYMLVAMAPEALAAMPADPAALIGPLTQQYDVAVQVNVQNVPEALRQQAVGMLGGLAQNVQKQPNESDTDFQARQQAVQAQIQDVQAKVRDLDQLRLGLSIAGDEQRVYFDVNALATPGSALAKEMTEDANVTTNFAGFANDDAAVALSAASNVNGLRAAQMEQFLANVRAQLSRSIDAEAPAELREGIRGSIGEIFDAVLTTLKAGKVDGGAVVFASPDAVRGVAGGLILEPAKIEAALKSLGETLAKAGDSDLPKINWGAETHGDIAFHTAAIPVKDDEAKILFGDQLDVVVGLGGQSAYVAWGKDAAATLKQVIDANGAAPNQATKPMELTIAVSKIVDAAKSVAKPDAKPVLEIVSSVLASAGGKDHAIVSSQVVDNGTQFRIEVEQGVIQAIATASMMQAMGGGQATPPPVSAEQ